MSTPEQEFKRLLHFGRKIPFYQPGDRLNNEFYHSSVSEEIKNLAGEKLFDITNCIVKAFSDGYSAHPSLLLYALAACAKQDTNEKLREEAYKAAKTVCSTPENLFLFIKFAIQLSQNSSIWGNGFRKVCKEWYLKKDAKALAEIIGKHERYNGWHHKDIIKLIHFKPETPVQAAIVKYTLFGLKAAKKDFGDNSEASEVLHYLQALEDFKHMKDEQQAARYIEIYKFTLEHVPSHLLKSKEVWGALIDNLPLLVLIQNLERLGYMKFLRPKSIFTDKVVHALNDENAIAESHLHPAQVFVTLRKYETSSKLFAFKKSLRNLRENNTMEVKTAKPNPEIISALHNLFSSTCKFLAPTGLKYLVAIDLKNHLGTNERCYRCSYVSPAQAAVVIALCLLNADLNVSVLTANALKNLEPVNLSPSMTVQKGVQKLKEAKMQKMKLFASLDWAVKYKKKYDVFVFITDIVHKEIKNIISYLQKYREEMNVPDAKFIAVLLKYHLEPTWINEIKDSGIFIICGFDVNVPRIIEAFSRGAF